MEAVAPVENIQCIVDRADKIFDILENRFNGLAAEMKRGFDKAEVKLESNINRLEMKTDTNFKWIVGMMITLYVINGFMPLALKIIIGQG